MRKQDVIEEYGGPAEVARVLGVSKQAVYRWGEIIPERRAARLSKLNKKLVYDPSFYQKEKK